MNLRRSVFIAVRAPPDGRGAKGHRCAPIVDAWEKGLDHAATVGKSIPCWVSACPWRLATFTDFAGVRDSGGFAIAVEDGGDNRGATTKSVQEDGLPALSGKAPPTAALYLKARRWSDQQE